MTAVLTCDEHRRLDAAAAAAGVPLEALMDRAGKAVAQAVADRVGRDKAILVLCGPGDNGGDGYVAARYLLETGRSVRVATSTQPREGTAAANARAAWKGWVEPLDPGALARVDLVVDALFGAGLSRPLDGVAAECAMAAATGRALVVAVDLPSGVSGDLGRPLGPSFRADATVTFGRRKPAHVLEPGRSLCGEVIVAPIGHPISAFEAVPPALFENNPNLWRDRWPWPKASTHKHARGRLIVVSGGVASTGAARLAARSGLRAGAGLVTLLTPPSALLVVASSSLAVMTRSFADAAALAAAAADAHAVVIGPGAGVNQATRDAVAAVLATSAKVVLDADALTVFADDPAALFTLLEAAPARAVLTPHAGEFRRLFPDLDPTEDKIAAARSAAQRAGAVVLLKGPDTVVAEPGGRAVVNTHASPFLATAGSGDVLAGVIGGALAQGMPPFDAACAACWIHGDAAIRLGPGMIAEDLCEALPKALGDLYHATAARGGARRSKDSDEWAT